MQFISFQLVTESMVFLIFTNRLNWRLLLKRFSFVVLLGGLLLYASWPWLPGATKHRRTLVLYGFSILGPVLDKGIFPAFQTEWKARTGETIELVSSYAGSGTIANQIILGVPAEIAILSTELDALRLSEKGVLQGPTWRRLPYQGVINRTPFIILVRQGNPLKVNGFEDLSHPGIGIVHPDPLTSGGGQWAILAEYGSGLHEFGDEDKAYTQLVGIWKNVVAQAGSARAARTQFQNGFGDALITYEQEAIYDRSRGRLTGEICYPRSTILSEHTAVVIEKNVSAEQRPVIEAFVEFLWSARAQSIFLEYGFRSIDESINRTKPELRVIEDPFTVNDLGGWEEADRRIIQTIWKGRVMKEIG